MNKEIGGNSYSIPFDNKILLRGVTGDSKQDIIVSIGNSFGASGHVTIYFFSTKNGDEYLFVKTFNSFDLALCKTNGGAGQYYPEEINNNTLIGHPIVTRIRMPNVAPQ